MKNWKKLLTLAMAFSISITAVVPSTVMAAELGSTENEVIEEVTEPTADNELESDSEKNESNEVQNSENEDVEDVTLTNESNDVPQSAVETEEPSENGLSVAVTEKGSMDEMQDATSVQAEAHTRLLVILQGELPDFVSATTIEHFEDVYLLSYADSNACLTDYATLTGLGYTVEYNDVIEAFNEEEVPDAESDVESLEETDEVTDETTTEEVVEDVTTEVEEITMKKQREIKVALIDTGINTEDELLKGHIADGYDTSNMSDVNGHGTLMAEIIAANTNENVKIVPYKVFDDNGKSTVGATYYALIRAINEQVDVISLSISGYGASNLLQRAVTEARNRGIYVITASGNNSDNAENYMPGNVEGTLNISAVNEDKTFAEYSNKGNNIDFSALGTIVKDNGTEDVDDDEIYTGTSISAARVSSMIATVLQYIKDDEATENNEVYDVLLSVCEDLGEEGKDEYFGWGYLSSEAVLEYLKDKAPDNEVVDFTNGGLEKDSEEEIIDFTDLDLDDAEQELDTSIYTSQIINTGSMSVSGQCHFDTPSSGPGGGMIVNYGTLYVSDLKGSGVSMQPFALIENYGTVILNGYFSNNGDSTGVIYGIYNHPGGTVTGSLNGNNSSGLQYTIGGCGDNVNISNGSMSAVWAQVYFELGGTSTFDNIKVEHATRSSNIGIYNTTGTVNLNNCSICSWNSGIICTGGTVNCNNCEVMLCGNGGGGNGDIPLAYANTKAGITVAGGTVNTNSNSRIHNNENGVYIFGGTYNCNSSSIYSNTTGVNNNGTWTLNNGNIYSNTNGIYNSGANYIRGGNIYSNNYGVYNRGTLVQTAGASTSNIWDVFQAGSYNLSNAGVSNKIYLAAGHVVNVPSVLYTGGHALYTADTDKQVTRTLVTSYGNADTTVKPFFSLGSNLLSNDPASNGSVSFTGKQGSGTIFSGTDFSNVSGNNYSGNALYLEGAYYYTYNGEETFYNGSEIPTPYNYFQYYDKKDVFNRSYTAKMKIDAHNNLKFIGWTYDKNWLLKDWKTIKANLLPEDYDYTLFSAVKGATESGLTSTDISESGIRGINENVYPVYDLQNVDLTYFGNGATESDEVAYLPNESELAVTQKTDGEYTFQDKEITNETFVGVAYNPFYRIEEYTAEDEYYFDVNADGGDGAYVDYTQYYTYEGWSSYRDNLKTYNGDGTYHTTEAGADLPKDAPNLTKYFLDELKAETVTFTDDGRASLNLYATWDKAPIITAANRYYNFEQLREIIESGTLNDDLLQDIFVKATDEEDGQGTDKLLELGTEVTVDNLDKLIEEIEKVLSDESSADHFGTTIRFKAEDKAGNITYYNAELYMVNNEIHSLEPEPEPGEDPDHPEDNFQDEDGNWYHYVRDDNGNYVYQNSACYVRRINLKNYLKHWKSGYSVGAGGLITGEVNRSANVSGALESYSKWYLNEDLQKKMYNALYNMEANTGKCIYSQTFDRDTIKQIQDEIFADSSKMQMDYIKSTWMKQYCNFN